MSKPPRPRSGEVKGSEMSGARPQISDFVLQERLGSGSYAVVYKAFWKTTNDTVAIKKIQKSRLNPAAINNILLEIEILKSIKHDFIVEMRDFTWDNDNIYLILEYCSGGDLSNFIKSRRRLPEGVCRRLMQQLAKALQFLRSVHIAHMDLKPKNILLSSNNDILIKLADFGFAQYLKSTEGATDLRGSPLYMAPEMFLSRVEELVTKITDGSLIVFPSDIKISDSCRDLLQRLLKKDPNQRISFAQFFAHEFLDFEHFPSEENYEKAMSLCKSATELDKAKDYQNAIKTYLAGLEFLVPALTYEKNESRKRLIKQRVQDYMSRTEQLKQLIKKVARTENRPSSSPPIFNEIEYIDETNVEHLRRIFTDDVIVVAALESGSTAEYMEEQGHYRLAIEYYEVAIERLIRASKAMVAGEKRTKLQRQISNWLERAESVNAKTKLLIRDEACPPSPPAAEEQTSNGLESSSRLQKIPLPVFRSHWY